MTKQLGRTLTSIGESPNKEKSDRSNSLSMKRDKIGNNGKMDVIGLESDLNLRKKGT